MPGETSVTMPNVPSAGMATAEGDCENGSVRTGSSGVPRQVYSIAADGSDDRPLLTTRSFYTHPVLQPVR